MKVPEDIVGQSLEYARESIQHAGLTVGPVSTVNSATFRFIPDDMYRAP